MPEEKRGIPAGQKQALAESIDHWKENLDAVKGMQQVMNDVFSSSGATCALCCERTTSCQGCTLDLMGYNCTDTGSYWKAILQCQREVENALGNLFYATNGMFAMLKDIDLKTSVLENEVKKTHRLDFVKEGWVYQYRGRVYSVVKRNNVKMLKPIMPLPLDISSTYVMTLTEEMLIHEAMFQRLLPSYTQCKHCSYEALLEPCIWCTDNNFYLQKIEKV